MAIEPGSHVAVVTVGKPRMCYVFYRKGLLLGLLMFWWSLLKHKPAFA